ncbi:MAG: type VI secretion system tube protein Hcp [Roseibacillus sp.]
MNSRTLHRVLLIGLLLTSGLPGARLYLKIEGIRGESTHAAYPGWIAADSLQFAGSLFNGAAGGFGVVKSPDRSSVRLLQALASERYLPRVTVAFLKPDPTNNAGEDVEFARVLFRDVLVRSCEQETFTSGTGEVLLQEKYRLSFRAVFYRYQSDAGESETSYVDLDLGADTDGDGMTDNYEDFFGLNKNLDDSALDTDGDGLTHLEEFRLGLNPRLSSSSFVPRGGVDPEDAENFQLTWATKPAKSYDVYFTSDLAQEPAFLRRVTASEMDSSTSFRRLQSRGFFSIREVVE